MPLSEYEQRVLHQMEQQLRSDDPRLASSLSPEPKVSVRRLVLGSLAVLAGLAMLVGGVALSQVWLGVLGFVSMLGGVMLAVTRQKRGPAPVAGAGSRPAARPAPAKRTGSGSFMKRLEERWDRRRDEH
ncbi:DUF3040 domain-containing protein [Georgenia faecalis]|uniref:DUF3040 domain-containing protein n=1 Tax=Georgenia faecalis TaxID=2483799 RepID=A0ABV9DC51_9MICO|nr:DUF3040 domain-containing protein [Georgenia faecalis]